MSRPYSNWEGLPSGWSLGKAVDDISHALFDLPEDDSTQRRIAEVGIALTHLLLLKNQRYGDSVMNPTEVFATGMTKRQRMGVRMDDKLNRIAKGLGTKGGDGEHPGIDLAGYLLLDIIAEWEENGA